MHAQAITRRATNVFDVMENVRQGGSVHDPPTPSNIESSANDAKSQMRGGKSTEAPKAGKGSSSDNPEWKLKPGEITIDNIDDVLRQIQKREEAGVPTRPAGARRFSAPPTSPRKRQGRYQRVVEEARTVYLKISAESKRAAVVSATPNDLRRLRAENNRLLRRYCQRTKFVSKFDNNTAVIASNVNPKAIHPHTLRKLQTQRASYRKKWLPYTERHRELLAKRAADREALSMGGCHFAGWHHCT